MKIRITQNYKCGARSTEDKINIKNIPRAKIKTNRNQNFTQPKQETQ